MLYHRHFELPNMEMTRSPTSASNHSVASSTASPSSGPTNVEPTKDALLLDVEVEALNKTLSTVSSKAARTFTRQNWRKCLVGGTAKDQSFLVRAMLKYSTPHVFARVLEEHGESLLEAADDEFLDAALEIRLRTIGAKDLVALLGQAHRLGYDEEDMVDEGEAVVPVQESQPKPEERDAAEVPPPPADDAVMSGTGAETDPLLDAQSRNQDDAALAQVALAQAARIQAAEIHTAEVQAATVQAPMAQAITTHAAPAQTHPYYPPMLQRVDLPSRRKSNGKFVCPDCNSQFSQQGGLTYHIERRVCHRPAPIYRWFCKSCGKGFTTSGGKLYHEQNKVCEGHEKAVATSAVGTTNLLPVPYVQDGTPSPRYGPVPPSHPPPSTSYAPQQISPYSMMPYNQEGQHNVGYHSPQQTASTPFRPPPGAEHHGYVRQNYADFYSPARSSARSPSAKTSPMPEQSPGDIQMLDAATQAELNAKIAAEVKRFEEKCREIPDTLTAAEREEEINKQKRGHATRKSQIRKKYGIQVRSSKNRAANFVRVSGTEESPHLEPIARIGAFRAPPAAVSSFSVTTPKIYEQGLPRPTIEGHDAKRRRVESASPGPLSRPDPYGVPGGLQRRVTASEERINRQPRPDEIEVDEPGEPGEPRETNRAESEVPERKQVPLAAAQRQWEALQLPQPLPSTSTANGASASRPGSSHSSRPPSAHGARPRSSHSAASAHNSIAAPIVLDSSGSESATSDNDSDPNEEIPARVSSVVLRRQRLDASRHQSISPRRVTRRESLGLLKSPLSKTGTKMRAAVPV